jgi:type IV secretory pathway VirB2 component (pilin)
MTMSKSTKILVAALALAATSLTFVANASAGPGQSGGWYQGQDAYMAVCRSRFCS